MEENILLINLVIDERLRTITIPNNGAVFGVVGDIEVNRVKFTMPRYYSGFDMSEFTARVNYVNANNIGNYYVADDMAGDDEGVSFTWLMAPDVTAYSGDVRFNIKLYKKQDDKITKSFNTRPGTGRVLEGLDVEQQVTPEQQLTILEKIEADVKMDIDEYTATVKKDIIDTIETLISVPSLSWKIDEVNEAIEFSFIGKWTEIPDYCFYENAHLKISQLPEGLTRIGRYAFAECYLLSSLKIPEGVISIDDHAFYYCSNLTSMELTNGISRIGKNAFYSCRDMVLARLPDSITHIDDSAFEECGAMAINKLPSELTYIGEDAFNYCSEITITEIPATVMFIGDTAFYACYGITTLTFKGTPDAINSTAFKRCDNLTTINVPWSEGAVANAPWELQMQQSCMITTAIRRHNGGNII